jgi:hypothetical protein
VNVPDGAEASRDVSSYSVCAAASIYLVSVVALVAADKFVDKHYIATNPASASRSDKNMVSREVPFKISLELRHRAMCFLHAEHLRRDGDPLQVR